MERRVRRNSHARCGAGENSETISKSYLSLSHATCYATLGVRTAWLSYYYPVEFSASMLNSYIGKADKIAKFIQSCNKRKIKLYNPDVNSSEYHFSIDTVNGKKGIRFGLAGIKGTGNIAAEAIIFERNKNGKYKSLSDFLIRTSNFMKADSLESLIKSGALDCFEGTRASKLENIPLIKIFLKKYKELQVEPNNQYTEFFGDSKVSIDLPDIEEYTDAELSYFEEEVLGFFLTHPIRRYKNQLVKYREKGLLTSISEINQIISKKGNSRKKYFFAGLVKNKEIIQYTDKKSKAQKQLLKFTLDDSTDTMNCVFFEEKAVKYGFAIKNGSIIYLSGTIKKDDFGLSCSGETLEKLSRE